jgi:hypothetical protein
MAGFQKVSGIQEYFQNYLVQYIVSQMTEDERQEHLTTNCMHICPKGNDLEIRLWSLKRVMLDDGQLVYHSRARPTVSIRDQEHVVCFSMHALQRIRERAAPESLGCTKWQRAFGIVDGCVYYEPVVLTNNAHAFTFYIDLANKQHEQDNTSAVWPATVFDNVIGKGNGMGKSWYYRVGYCPIEINSDYAVAKTLLFPGFVTTPEYEEIRNSPDLTTPQKDRLLGSATNMTAQYVFMNQDYELLKWLQQHGTPQVRPLDGEIFRPTSAD